ncbi:MAG: endonuclease/exonuclease/phosphatase [Chloroflexi bacterium RBG_16_69_14]|nr:MAG: endonuclease/exonuclease/phosphatase [Chloroflexi bacterium RBG_16_69_14]
MTFDYFVAWWNLENLLDVEDSPRRTEKVARALGNDIVGWTPALLDRKVSQLGSVIAQMNGGAGPELLGICEVENEFVVDKLVADLNIRLPNRHYSKVHADTQDQRGIDVAFVFDPQSFTAPVGEIFHHVVMRRTATRDLLQVNFTTHRGRTWSVFANHWPSRSGGAMESAGYRAIAGETLAYFHERAIAVHGDSTPVLAMGDFNDEPFDASLVQYALSTRQRLKVVNGTSPRLWNLMWGHTGAAQGTFYFDEAPNLLDQFLINKNMARQASPIRALPETTDIIRFAGMTATGDYPKPIPFGGMGKPVNQNGFSDHFPIGVVVREAD